MPQARHSAASPTCTIEVRRLGDLGLRDARRCLVGQHLGQHGPARQPLEDRVALLRHAPEHRFRLQQLPPHGPPLRAHSREDEHRLLPLRARTSRRPCPSPGPVRRTPAVAGACPRRNRPRGRGAGRGGHGGRRPSSRGRRRRGASAAPRQVVVRLRKVFQGGRAASGEGQEMERGRRNPHPLNAARSGSTASCRIACAFVPPYPKELMATQAGPSPAGMGSRRRGQAQAQFRERDLRVRRLQVGQRWDLAVLQAQRRP